MEMVSGDSVSAIVFQGGNTGDCDADKELLASR